MKRALLAITGAFDLGGGIAAVNRLVIRALEAAEYSLDIFALLEDTNLTLTGSLSENLQTFSGNKVNFSFAVWRALLSHSYDLIFSDHVNLASIFTLFRFIKRFRPVVWLHGVEVFPPLPDFEGRLGLNAARVCLSSSEFTRMKVLERFPNKPVTTCDLALSPDFMIPDRPIYSDSESMPIELDALDGITRQLGKRVVLFVGRMDPNGRYKGQVTLLNALPLILEKVPDVQLVFAGDGPDLSYYQQIAKSLPEFIQSNIFFPGFVSSELLDRLYRDCFMFAMPSHGEGFGLVYLEAMWYAKPCLGSRNDAASCVIQDGITGILVDEPVTPEQITIRSIELLCNPDRAKQMGVAGYELVCSHYQFKHFQERFFKVLAI